MALIDSPEWLYVIVSFGSYKLPIPFKNIIINLFVFNPVLTWFNVMVLRDVVEGLTRGKTYCA